MIQNIATGTFHTLFLTDCKLYAVGNNVNGQLGIGNQKNQLIPIEISFFNDKKVLDICCGDKYSLVYTSKS